MPEKTTEIVVDNVHFSKEDKINVVDVSCGGVKIAEAVCNPSKGWGVAAEKGHEDLVKRERTKIQHTLMTKYGFPATFDL
jgi:hypothetical protein